MEAGCAPAGWAHIVFHYSKINMKPPASRAASARPD
jgi:hypothetical protein